MEILINPMVDGVCDERDLDLSEYPIYFSTLDISPPSTNDPYFSLLLVPHSLWLIWMCPVLLIYHILIP